MSRVSRRQLIRLLGGAAAVMAAAPACDTTATGSSAVFTDDQRSALSAIADVIIPPDDDPGGAALGAVPYIEKLFSAFDGTQDPPPIFAGGPYSGRAPFPDASGQASNNFPPNDFQNFIELDRVNDAGWRMYVNGSAGIPTGGPNDKITGPVAGMKADLIAGLNTAMQANDGPLAELGYDLLISLFNQQDQDWKDLMIELVTEAAFAAPEYGGNIGLAGWKICNFEGDSQPLGYSQWNGTNRVERPESPLSTANPGVDPAPISSDVDGLLQLVMAVLGGRVASS